MVIAGWLRHVNLVSGLAHQQVLLSLVVENWRVKRICLKCDSLWAESQTFFFFHSLNQNDNVFWHLLNEMFISEMHLEFSNFSFCCTILCAVSTCIVLCPWSLCKLVSQFKAIVSPLQSDMIFLGFLTEWNLLLVTQFLDYSNLPLAAIFVSLQERFYVTLVLMTWNIFSVLDKSKQTVVQSTVFSLISHVVCMCFGEKSVLVKWSFTMEYLFGETSPRFLSSCASCIKFFFFSEAL